MDIKTREYTTSDKEFLKQLIEKLMDYIVSTDPIKRIRRMDGFSDKNLRHTLKLMKTNKGKIYFALDDEKIVGYVFGFVNDKQSKENLTEVIPTQLGTIEDLYIEESYRGKGVGTVLLNKIESYLENEGCDSLWIEVFAPNKQTHEYYKKMGYLDREVGMLKQLNIK